MVVLLLSLTTLFGASLVAVAVTRNAAKTWNSADLSLSGLWPGTAILLLLSVTMEHARARVASNSQLGMQRALWGAFGLGVAFLASQGLAFNREFSRVLVPAADALPLFGFVLLVSLHALHVVGGLIGLGLTIRRAARGDYSSSRAVGIRLTAQYWHFLAAIWLVLLAALYWIH